MNTLHEIEQALTELTRGEKAQLLQWIARDLGDAFPGIESMPGVSGDPGQSRGGDAGAELGWWYCAAWFS